MMNTEKIIGRTKLVLVQGDITKQETEAIVNAANSSLMGGGGVDGAIHRSGGPAILEECKKIVLAQKSCPAGQAVITTGGRLPAKYVIHTVGPVWHGGAAQEEKLLASAYANSLSLALKHQIRSLAFPSISTGAYRFPIEKAAAIAVKTITDFIKENPEAFSEVRMVLFSTDDYQVYERTLTNAV